ncbi:MAG: TPM domain-containing protein [Firmicutes bacterium]|nr:TPM domain-containing protein [Bacillota bacterium]
MRSFLKRWSGFLFIVLLLCLVAIVPAGAQENYRKFVTGYVNDHAGLIRPEEVRELSAFLAAFDEQTTNQFIVVTLPTLPPGESLELFALKLAEAAQAGTAEHDNGLLLLILSEERKIRVEVGLGLEEKITDGRAGRVIREVLAPAFQKEAYYSGIKDAVLAFVNWVEPSYFPEGSAGAARRLEEQNGAGAVFFVVLFFILLFISAAYSSRHQQPPEGGYPPRTTGPVIYPPPRRSSNRSFKNSGGGKFRGGGGGFRGGGASGGW